MPTPSHGGEGRHDAPSRDAPSIVGGLILIAIAGIALWAMSDLYSGSLSELGPGGLPRVTALLLGLIGIALIAGGWRRLGGQPISGNLTGLAIIMAAIVVFAVTLRPLGVGDRVMPGLGLIGAGPLAIFVAGLAARQVAWLDLAALACGLTAFCMILFGDLLALPIPMFPVSWLAHAPAGWGQIGLLRALAVALAAVSALLIILARRRRIGGKAS